jgi:hypothetical protein
MPPEPFFTIHHQSTIEVIALMSHVSLKGGTPALRSRTLVLVVGLGTLSALLYLLLFQLADRLTAMAAATREGEKLYALVPIAIAMVFSFVHGAFTAHFWDVLGLRAKN